MKKRAWIATASLLLRTSSGCAVPLNHAVLQVVEKNSGVEPMLPFNGLVCLHVMISSSLKSFATNIPSWLLRTDESALSSAAEQAITEGIRNDGASVRDRSGRSRIRYIDKDVNQPDCSEIPGNMAIMIQLNLNSKNEPYFLSAELRKTPVVIRAERSRDVSSELNKIKDTLSYLRPARRGHPTPIVANPVAWNSLNDTYELICEIIKPIKWGDVK